jgi:hypothetical protein
MKLACIVLAYHLPAQLARLIARLQHPDVHVYAHIDRRARIDPFHEAVAAGRSEVTWLRRHRSVWGSAGCVDATLEGLRAGFTDGCDYFVVISGQDLPLRRIDEILDFTEQNRDRCFIEHWPISASRHRFGGRDRTDFYAYTLLGRRELCIPRGEDVSFLGVKGRLLNELLRARTWFMPARRFPEYLSPFAGATWWNASRAGVAAILDFVERHPDYREYHEHTWVPEEIFFQSILAGTEFASAHEVVNDALRLYDWDDVRARTLRSEDVATLGASPKLFARKFDPDFDPGAVASALELSGPHHEAAQ